MLHEISFGDYVIYTGPRGLEYFNKVLDEAARKFFEQHPEPEAFDVSVQLPDNAAHIAKSNIFD